MHSTILLLYKIGSHIQTVKYRKFQKYFCKLFGEGPLVPKQENEFHIKISQLVINVFNIGRTNIICNPTFPPDVDLGFVF